MDFTNMADHSDLMKVMCERVRSGNGTNMSWMDFTQLHTAVLASAEQKNGQLTPMIQRAAEEQFFESICK
jgi:hypothetical protein